jgi:hypothetical protein
MARFDTFRLIVFGESSLRRAVRFLPGALPRRAQPPRPGQRDHRAWRGSGPDSRQDRVSGTLGRPVGLLFLGGRLACLVLRPPARDKHRCQQAECDCGGEASQTADAYYNLSGFCRVHGFVLSTVVRGRSCLRQRWLLSESALRGGQIVDPVFRHESQLRFLTARRRGGKWSSGDEQRAFGQRLERGLEDRLQGAAVDFRERLLLALHAKLAAGDRAGEPVRQG